MRSLDRLVASVPDGKIRADVTRAREGLVEATRAVQTERERELRRADDTAERQRFEALFEASPTADFVTDRLGVIKLANRRAGELFSIDTAELVGTPMSTLVETKDLRAFRSALGALQRGDRVGATEIRFRPAGSPPFDAWVYGTPAGLRSIRLEVRWTLIDLPQSARESAGWREREATMRRFVDGMPALAWATDLHLRITMFRGAGLATIGLRPDELAGNYLFAFLGNDGPDGTPSPLMDAHLRALDDEESTHVHAIQDRWYQTRVEPLHDAHGNVTGCTAISVDVTDQKELEAVLGRALARERGAVALLRSVDRAKDALLSSIAHDMRSPLATITLSAQMLTERRSELPDGQAEHLLLLIRQSGERLSRYVSEAFDPARMSEDMIAAARTRLDVGGLVRIITEETHVPERSVEIDVRAVEAEVDPIAIERIVANLLANVVSHTPAGTRVWVRAAPASGGVVITVEDDGPGVPDDAKESVFAPHVRGAGSDGTGVGLGLVARYTEMHGGRAWVEDRAGGGASFKVFLPTGAPAAQSPDP